MASSSPVSGGKIGDSITAIGAINGNATPQRPGAFEMPRQSLRGLNKPKCIKCGNVARSRCPFQSCKSCCAKAENPCHIHVLKQNGTLPDKPPPSSSTSAEPPSNDVSTTGSSWRLNSLRQLSANVANIIRTKKPLTKSDAVMTNKWRFMKLREHVEQDIELENEAFDRYMQNVNLLEETFSIMDGNGPVNQVGISAVSTEKLVSEIKMKLKANSERADSFRERMWSIINQKLNELQKGELASDDCSTYEDEPDDNCKEFKRAKKVMKCRYEGNAATSDMINKLNTARNEEDLRSCLEMKLQLLHRIDAVADASNDMKIDNHLPPNQESEATLSVHLIPKMWETVHVDEDTYENISTEKFIWSRLQGNSGLDSSTSINNNQHNSWNSGYHREN